MTAPTTQAQTCHPNLVQLTSGEKLEAGEVCQAGIRTDAGLIPWKQIDGTWFWSDRLGGYTYNPK